MLQTQCIETAFEMWTGTFWPPETQLLTTKTNIYQFFICSNADLLPNIHFFSSIQELPLTFALFPAPNNFTGKQT